MRFIVQEHEEKKWVSHERVGSIKKAVEAILTYVENDLLENGIANEYRITPYCTCCENEIDWNEKDWHDCEELKIERKYEAMEERAQAKRKGE